MVVNKKVARGSHLDCTAYNPPERHTTAINTALPDRLNGKELEVLIDV